MKMLLTLLSILWSSMATATTIYVAPVQGTNLPEAQLKTLRELVKVEVQNSSDYQLVDVLGEAQFYIQTKVIKFESYTLSMVRWQGNKKVFTGQWRANSLAELEQKMSVAVRETLSGEVNSKPAVLYENNKSLGERAAEKNQKANFERVPARRQVLVGFGPAFFDKMNTAQAGIGFQAGYIWSIDDHFDLGLQSDFAISTEHTDAYMLSGRILTNYYFSSNDISPYIGAGFGYGWASIHDSNTNTISDDAAGGFALGLQAGVKFFRTSTVNFAIGGEYTHIFDKSSLGNPGVFLLKVALLY